MKREFKTTLKVLNAMRKDQKSFDEARFLNGIRIFDREKVSKLCEELKALGYLDTLVIDSAKTIRSITLSYRGMTYKEENRAAFWKACLAWFTQNLVGLAALIVSIIALIRSL